MKHLVEAGLAVALAVFTGAEIAHALHQREEVVAVDSAVDMGAIVHQVVATGTLQAVATVDVGAQVSGTVQSLGADFNAIVHAGQILARLEPSSYDAELAQAQATVAEDAAQVENATVAVNEAQRQLTRATALFSAQLLTQEDFDAARVAMDTATASLKSAQAQEAQARAAVEGAEIDLAHTVIRAPIDGIVVARDVDAGQTVAAAVQAPTLFTLASDLTTMQLQADIDESDVGDLKAGDAVSFTVDAYPSERFRGFVSVVRLEPMVEQSSTTSGGNAAGSGAASADRSGTAQAATISTLQAVPPGSVVSYTTIINVANPDERLRPGMTATMTIETARRDDVLRIATSALAFRPSADVLRVAGERPTEQGAEGRAPGTAATAWLYDSGHFTQVNLRTGLADDQWAEVLSGPLRAGEHVVTSATLQRRN